MELQIIHFNNIINQKIYNLFSLNKVTDGNTFRLRKYSKMDNILTCMCPSMRASMFVCFYMLGYARVIFPNLYRQTIINNTNKQVSKQIVKQID